MKVYIPDPRKGMRVFVVPQDGGPPRRAPGPADLHTAEPGDKVVLLDATPEDGAAWGAALWYAVVRGVQVEARQGT